MSHTKEFIVIVDATTLDSKLNSLNLRRFFTTSAERSFTAWFFDATPQQLVDVRGFGGMQTEGFRHGQGPPGRHWQISTKRLEEDKGFTV